MLARAETQTDLMWRAVLLKAFSRKEPPPRGKIRGMKPRTPKGYVLVLQGSHIEECSWNQGKRKGKRHSQRMVHSFTLKPTDAKLAYEAKVRAARET